MDPTTLSRPQGTEAGPPIATMDDLLAEIAMTYPLAGYAAVEEADAESAFDHQILGGLISP